MNRSQEIVQKISSGESMAAIGRELGITRERVRQIVHLEEIRITELMLLRPVTNEYGVTIIKLMRIEQGATLKETSAGISINPSTLSILENGKCCKIKHARKIANYYGVPLGNLYAALDKEAFGETPK
jgi:DNA-binding CsgD family transcriptional regulator